MQDVLHNNRNEDNAEDNYELVDMDDGDHEGVNSDQEYVNVDQDDSVLEYVNVETRFRTVSMLILQITEVCWTITVKIYESYLIINFYLRGFIVNVLCLPSIPTAQRFIVKIATVHK